MSKLYVAYGANLNKRSMKSRCPLAIPRGTLELKGYKLIFNNVANIIKSKDDSVPVVVWSIEKQCEESLDKFEGFPSLYRKEEIDLAPYGLNIGFAYIMNYQGYRLPSKSYLDAIREGYDDFGLDKEKLANAVLDSSREVHPYQIVRGGSRWS